MTKYVVLDNGMLADTSPYGAMSRIPKGKGFDNAVFDTKLQAYRYAYAYLDVPYVPQIDCDVACMNDLFERGYKYTRSDDTIQVLEWSKYNESR